MGAPNDGDKDVLADRPRFTRDEARYILGISYVADSEGQDGLDGMPNEARQEAGRAGQALLEELARAYPDLFFLR